MPSPRRKPSLFLWLLGAVVVVVACIWIASRADPRWWARPVADDRAARTADRFEQGVAAQLQRIRPPEERWAVRLEESQINDWLATRLRLWVEHQGQAEWPEQLTSIRVDLRRRTINVGAEINGRVYSTTVTPMLETGVRLRFGQVWVGRIPLAGLDGGIANLIDSDSLDGLLNNQTLGPWLEPILKGDPIYPIVTLADDRTVEVVDFEIIDDAILVECITRPR